MNILCFEKLKEHKQHGDAMFSAALYPVTHNVAGRILPHHWHSELEFIYLSDGEAVFTIDDHDILIKEGECIFINSGQLHSGISNTCTCTYFSIVFSTEFLSNTLDACHQFFDGIKINKFKILQHFTHQNNSQVKVISELKDIIDELTDKNIAYELSVKSKLFSIFTILFRSNLYTIMLDNQKDLTETKKYNTLKQIIGYIYQNYNKKIKLTYISKSLNLTPQYLCKFFKEMTNTSIVEYINHYRIETACSLLKISTLSITDIALECGFDNISYFNRVFKRQLSVTPTEFRFKFYIDTILDKV
jgi:AraC-like DNA-binding protein